MSIYVSKKKQYEKERLNDFGLEIDIASQIIKNNFFIYEVGVSYFSRTVKGGKKIIAVIKTQPNILSPVHITIERAIKFKIA